MTGDTETAANTAMEKSKIDLLLSYLALRRLVGALAVLFPVGLIIWGIVANFDETVQNSVSDYYNTDARDLFVGSLFAIAIFLFTYRGYGRKTDAEIALLPPPNWIDKMTDKFSDNWAGNVAAVGALGVVFFPINKNDNTDIAHGFFKAVLILSMAYFCFFLFTLPRGSKKKLKRKFMYRVCGSIILICLLLAFVNAAALHIDGLLLYLELFALWAFGASWFVKGKKIEETATEPTV